MPNDSESATKHPKRLLSLIKCVAFVIRSKARGKKVIVFELSMLGLLPYILPLIREVVRLKHVSVVLAVTGDFTSTSKDLAPLMDDVYDRLFLTTKTEVSAVSAFLGIDLFITSEQFRGGLPGVYSISIFHGQPSKGITFTKEVLSSFDAFFLFGPLHSLALQKFQDKSRDSLLQPPEIFEVGYTKLDDLLNGKYSRQKVLQELALGNDRKTILYAPAFNEYATLRTIGFQLIERLKGIEGANVIIKLAPDSINNPSNFYSTGGVNWKQELRKVENDNVRLIDDLDINPYLIASDVMVTDVSGVAYDFLLLDKPVVFYDCPDFYSKYVPRYSPELTIEECLSDDTINAGRNYGLVVHDLDELRTAVTHSLDHPSELSHNRKGLGSLLLYNPGKATEVAVQTIEKLLEDRVKSRRPYKRTGLIRMAVSFLRLYCRPVSS